MTLSSKWCPPAVLVLCVVACMTTAALAREGDIHPPTCYQAKCSTELTACLLDYECAKNYQPLFGCVVQAGCGHYCGKCFGTNDARLQALVACSIKEKCLPEKQFPDAKGQMAMPEAPSSSNTAIVSALKAFTTMASKDGTDEPVPSAPLTMPLEEEDFLYATNDKDENKSHACQMIPKFLRCRHPKAGWNYYETEWKVGTCTSRGFNDLRGRASGCEGNWVLLPPSMSHTQWVKSKK